MHDRFYDDGVICWPRALTPESSQLAQEAYQWSLDHPDPGAGDMPSKNSGTFYQGLANPDAFSFYKTLIKHPDIIAIIRKLFASEHAWFMYEQVFRQQGGGTRRTPWHQDTPQENHTVPVFTTAPLSIRMTTLRGYTIIRLTPCCQT